MPGLARGRSMTLPTRTSHAVRAPHSSVQTKAATRCRGKTHGIAAHAFMPPLPSPAACFADVQMSCCTWSNTSCCYCTSAYICVGTPPDPSVLACLATGRRGLSGKQLAVRKQKERKKLVGNLATMVQEMRKVCIHPQLSKYWNSLSEGLSLQVRVFSGNRVRCPRAWPARMTLAHWLAPVELVRM